MPPPNPNAPQPAPAAAPQPAPPAAPNSAETQEIMKRYQMRKKIYPDIKTGEDLEKMDYNGLTVPLEKHEKDLPSHEGKFLKIVKEVEGLMGSGNIADFSFGALKNIPEHKGVCENLESRISIVQQSAAANPPPPPDLEALFKSKDNAEFNSNLNDPNIVNPKFSQDAEFKDRATLVFNTLKSYKDQNGGSIKNQTVRMYLNEIFKATNPDELEKIMKSSTIIRESSITPEIRAKIKLLHDKYDIYRKDIKKQLELEVIINKEKETVLTSPAEYARSGGKFLADKVQGFRENWAGMDGKERFIAGATILVGLSWFLNSKNEDVGEARDLLKKAGIIGLGYFALNNTTKLITGKTAKEIAASTLDEKSGKRDFLKAAFDTDKHGAEIMNTALVFLGPYDFVEVSESYLRLEAKYKTYPVADNQRELPLGGLAEDQMHPRQIYTAMRLLNRKLEKEGSSLEQLVNGLKKVEKESKDNNQPFTRPTFALILTATLQKDILKHKIDKDGKITLSKTEKIEVPFDPDQRAATRKWWMVTGTPEDWKKQHYDPQSFPREEFSESNAKHISSNVIDIKKPLSTVIEDQYFGRYTAGFKSLYDLKIKDKPTEKIHMLPDTKKDENAVYISSRVPVDYESFKSQTRPYAQVAAVKSAYDEALKEIEAQYGNTPAFKDVKTRIHEFVQPVFGTFLAESSPGKIGPIKEYVMFLRLVLPGNVEFALRKDKEWADGDMIQMMKKEQEPMKLGDKLTRAEFETLAQTVKRADIKTRFPNLTLTASFISVYGGAYECFLTNMRIKKSDTAKIETVLDYFSRTYAGSGLSKVGLVRYLASHNFTDAEIKTAYGSNEPIPNEGLDVRALVTAKTGEADAEVEKKILEFEAKTKALDRSSPSNIIEGAKMDTQLAEMKDSKLAWNIVMKTGFDKFFIALCNGDDKALGNSVIKNSPEMMGIIPLITTTTNPGRAIDAAKKALFESTIMNLYKKILIEAAEKKEVLTKVMEAVEEYRKPA